MLTCSRCQTSNPDTARYCMACGSMLPVHADGADRKPETFWGMSSFTFSLLASLALSLVLMFVFRLPIFIIAGFLPLLWHKLKKDK